MARQVRSEATRRKLLDAAIDEFSEVGYVAAARTAIIERAGVTKGALYHHFDSIDSLVTALVEGGFATILATFRTMCQPTSPALEGMIHGMFAVSEVLSVDKQARAAGHLVFALAQSNELGVRFGDEWAAVVGAQTARAITEGDVRADLGARYVAEAINSAMFGTWLLTHVGGDRIGRVTRMWQALLPGMVVEASLSYFLQFVAREELRYRAAGSDVDVDR